MIVTISGISNSESSTSCNLSGIVSAIGNIISTSFVCVAVSLGVTKTVLLYKFVFNIFTNFSSYLSTQTGNAAIASPPTI